MGDPEAADVIYPDSSYDPEIAAINGFRAFVSAIGILGNVCVILLILILSEWKKGITAWYILQLAIADTAFLITLPFQIVEDQHNSWMFPNWMCKAKQAVLFVNYYCSISFLTIMAIDRYIAICHSFSGRLQKLRTHRAAYIITAVVWIVSILICIPTIIYSQVQGFKPYCRCMIDYPGELVDPVEYCIEEGLGDDTVILTDNMTSLQFCLSVIDFPGPKEYCDDPLENVEGPVVNTTGEVLNMGCHYLNHSKGFLSLIYFNFFVMFLLPFLTIAVCYGLIIRHLIATAFKGDSNAGAAPKSANKDDRNRNRVVIMCGTLVAVFTVCWVPFHSVHMAKMNGIPGSTDYCTKLLYATSLLIYLNSAINPFVYFFITRCKSQLSRIKKTSAGTALVSFFTRPTNVENGGSKSGNNSSDKSKTATGKTEEDSRVKEATTGV